MLLASTFSCKNFIVNSLKIWKNILMVQPEHLHGLPYFLNLFYLNKSFKWKKKIFIDSMTSVL